MISPWRLLRQDTGQVVVHSLEVADSAWKRFKGLQFRARLEPGSGLLLVPCPSVHTLFMRFPIDVLILDRQGGVVAVRRRVPPWRVVLPVRFGYASLELPADTCDLDVGATLRLDPSAEIPLPRSLSFLCPTPTPKVER